MGGITETLTFEKKTMKELNFSCDPEASFAVLRYGKMCRLPVPTTA